MRKWIKHIFADRIQILLTLALSIISFLLCFLALTNSFVFHQQVHDLNQLFRAPTSEVHVLNFSYIKDFSDFGPTIQKLKQDIRTGYHISCGSYTDTTLMFEELMSDPSYVDLNNEEFKSTFATEDPYLSNVILLDPELLDIIDCPLTKDMMLPISDGKDSYPPIYVGIKYKDLIKKGTILTDSITGTKYIVNGYLEDGHWFDSSDAFGSPVASLDCKFIAPFTKETLKDEMLQMSTIGNIYYHCTNKDQASISSYILEQTAKQDIKVSLSSVDENLKDLANQNKDSLHLMYKFAFIVMFCSMISISTLFCTFILLHKKEYGIRLAFGETRAHILFGYTLRHFLLVVIALLIDILIVQNLFSTSILPKQVPLYLNTLNHYALPICFGISILYTMLSLLLPVFTLHRLELVQLIKEEDL